MQRKADIVKFNFKKRKKTLNKNFHNIHVNDYSHNPGGEDSADDLALSCRSRSSLSRSSCKFLLRITIRKHPSLWTGSNYFTCSEK